MKRLRCASLHSVTLTTSVMCFISAFVPRRFNGWTAVLKKTKTKSESFHHMASFFLFLGFFSIFHFIRRGVDDYFPLLSFSSSHLVSTFQGGCCHQSPHQRACCSLGGRPSRDGQTLGCYHRTSSWRPRPKPCQEVRVNQTLCSDSVSLHRLSVHFPALQGLINHSRCCLKLFFLFSEGEQHKGWSAAKQETHGHKHFHAFYLLAFCRRPAVSTRTVQECPGPILPVFPQ